MLKITLLGFMLHKDDCRTCHTRFTCGFIDMRYRSLAIVCSVGPFTKALLNVNDKYSCFHFLDLLMIPAFKFL